jgi:uncharacterized OB-fold protein
VFFTGSPEKQRKLHVDITGVFYHGDREAMMMSKCPCCQRLFDPSKGARCPICSMKQALEALGMSQDKVAAIMAEVTQAQPAAG